MCLIHKPGSRVAVFLRKKHFSISIVSNSQTFAGYAYPLFEYTNIITIIALAKIKHKENEAE